MFSDELIEAILEEKVTEELIHDAVRKGTLSLELTPVFMGSAYKNKGVQPLLDAVTRYLPSPTDVENVARRPRRTTRRRSRSRRPEQAARRARVQARGRPLRPAHLPARLPGHARQGRARIVNSAHQAARARSAGSSHARRRDGGHRRAPARGDIVALFGIDCASGDTFTDGAIEVAMSSMHVPEPVISLVDQAQGQRRRQDNIAKALGRFTQEDPTFHAARRRGDRRDDHLGHGRAAPRRLRRAHEARVQRRGRDRRAAGRLPRDDLRSAPSSTTRTRSRPAARASTARSAATSSRSRRASFEFVDEVRGGAIPTEFIPSVEKGFRLDDREGPPDRLPGDRACAWSSTTAPSHAVDSSDIAFQAAAPRRVPRGLPARQAGRSSSRS